VDPIGAWTTLLVSVAVVAGTLVAMRERLPRTWIDVLVALGSAGIALGGLLLLDDVGPWSWVVAPVLLAGCGVLQWRLLFAPGGPMRT
jgi:hypothetical protein